MSTEFVRIKDPDTGAEYTYDRAKLVALGIDDSVVIDRPALGPNGLPAPAKPSLPLGEPLPGSAAERRRAKGKAAAGDDKTVANQTIAELRAEIERRNAERAEDDQITPAGKNKADLVAALEDDDAAASAAQTTEATSPGEDAGQTSATEKEN